MSAEVDALQRVLSGVNAAIFAAGAIGAPLTGDELALTRDGDRTHRTQRDTLSDLITGAGGTPTPGAAAYRLPKPVTDRAGAIALAVDVETKLTAVWRSALGTVTGAAREVVLDGLTDAAVRSAKWRALNTPDAYPTVTWPGS